MTRSTQCIFCPKKADSKEHVWSKWILDMLPSSKMGVFTRRLADGTMHSRNVRKPEVTAKLVCKIDCNNGWMSTKLEVPMQAATADIILNPRSKVFSPSERTTIAAWAFKTAVVANHRNLTGEPFFSLEQRYAFARDLSIPRGVQVWIAKRETTYVTGTYRSITYVKQPRGVLSPHLLAPPDSPYRFELYVCTFSIGYLLLQVAATRWTKREIAQRLDYPPIRQPQIFDAFTGQVWPNDGLSLEWPPPLSIGDPMAKDFWERLNRCEIPAWMR